MKNLFSVVMLLMLLSAVVFLMIVLDSCKKTNPSGENPGIERKIRFQLYTNEDFSDETSVITFSIFIKKAQTTLFDSSLAPMQLKDIPDSTHKIVIEKTISG